MTTTDFQSENSLPYRTISQGTLTGEYQGFPDACRLHNGDIAVVFYAGYDHVSYPNAEYPTGGKICMTRSSDEGRNWSEPVVIYDDEYDNRDPHIGQLSNGTLICSFFSLRRNEEFTRGYECIGPQIIRSDDGGKAWEAKGELILTDTKNWVCSAPVRELPTGICILPIYHQDSEGAWGGIVRSSDQGETWSREIPLGQESGLFLPAETDVIQLKDGSLYAALRGDQGKHMHFTTSPDLGLSWSPVKDIGFEAHAPHFNRLNSGEIMMACRGINPDRTVVTTAIYVSRNECQSWLGPYRIDSAGGAYPATVELKDGYVMAIYYTDGPGSKVRALRFCLPSDIEPLPFD